MAMTIEDFLASARVTDGAKMMYLCLLRQPDGTANLTELSEACGRSPASICRWTQQLTKAKMIKTVYRGNQKAIYSVIPVDWNLVEKTPSTTDGGRTRPDGPDA